MLGPVLFLVLINDLRQLGDVLLFGDDTTICAKGSTPEEARDRALQSFDKTKESFAANRLCLKESKIQAMTCLTFLIIPDNMEDVKLLGFTLDPKLLADVIRPKCAVDWQGRYIS